MAKLPKHYRKEIYEYVEELLGRTLTFEEHDTLRDMMIEYVFSMRRLSMYMKHLVCVHAWVSDKQVEGGKQPKVHMKCTKCDKRSVKRMPMVSS